MYELRWQGANLRSSVPGASLPMLTTRIPTKHYDVRRAGADLSGEILAIRKGGPHVDPAACPAEVDQVLRTFRSWELPSRAANVELLDVLSSTLRSPRSRALYPYPSAPPRYEIW